MGKYSIALLTISVAIAVGSLPLLAQTNSSGLSEISAPKPTTDVYFINRAKNLARQSATKANGGLERYRPDPVMYGPAVQTPYVNNSNGSITFTFKGSIPGAAAPSIETVATVMPDGSVNLDYNGAIRGGATGSLPASNPSASSPSAPPSSKPISSPVPSPNGLPTLNSPDPSSSVPPSSPGTVPAASTSSNGPSNGVSTPTSIADQDAFLSKARNIARQSAIKANGGLDRYRPETSMFGPAAKSPYVKNADGSLTFTFKGGSPGSTTMTLESVITVSSTGSANIQYNGPLR